MPCGSITFGAILNALATAAAPKRRALPAAYSKTRRDAPSTTQMLWLRPVGSIVIPVGEPFARASVQLPTATPYAWSPEFFIHNGKSYVFFQMNTSSNWNDYTKPNLLAMMGITDDNSQIQKLVASGAKSRARTDPEYFITAQGPFIYYNRYAYDGTTLTSEGIWRVDTGLGPAVAPTVGTNVSKKAK